MEYRDIIVVGASAGGIAALKRLVASLPKDLPASVFITLHLLERRETILPGILQMAGNLPVIDPQQDQPIERGCIYVAPPDYHLMLREGKLHLGHGPKENLQRPCINVMFRSAALSYGRRVIGALLTGMLDDGAAGLWEIQRHGGIAIAQDPEEAAYRSMPDSAIRGFRVDYVVRVAEMGGLMSRLISEDNEPSAEKTPVESVRSEASGQSCPECGGVMKQAKLGNLYEYRCHTGHRYGLKTLTVEKSDVIERSLWNALSQTEELIQLLEHSSDEVDETALKTLRHEIEKRSDQARQLRRLLESASSTSLKVS